LKINDDLIEQVNKLEEEFVKNDIFSTENIEAALSFVEREFVLVVVNLYFCC
jgi:hypothetical protein